MLIMWYTPANVEPTTPFWLKMHSSNCEYITMIGRFHRQPTSDYENALLNWAFETSKALETLQKIT